MENNYIACVWCNTNLYIDKQGWHQCDCKAIAIDVTPYYYRVIGNFEDVKLGGT